MRASGNFSLVATTCRMWRWKAWPKIQGRRDSSLVRLLMEVPEPNLKLWSWVSLSFAMMLPCSSIVFCGAMLTGARQMPGMLMILSLGIGSAKP